jgi:hypothetical protein
MGQQFDDLSKALASGISRRQALMALVGGLVGGAGALLNYGISLASGRRCPRGSHSCDSTTCCPDGRECVRLSAGFFICV